MMDLLDDLWIIIFGHLDYEYFVISQVCQRWQVLRARAERAHPRITRCAVTERGPGGAPTRIIGIVGLDHNIMLSYTYYCEPFDPGTRHNDTLIYKIDYCAGTTVYWGGLIGSDPAVRSYRDMIKRAGRATTNYIALCHEERRRGQTRPSAHVLHYKGGHLQCCYGRCVEAIDLDAVLEYITAPRLHITDYIRDLVQQMVLCNLQPL